MNCISSGDPLGGRTSFQVVSRHLLGSEVTTRDKENDVDRKFLPKIQVAEGSVESRLSGSTQVSLQRVQAWEVSDSGRSSPINVPKERPISMTTQCSSLLATPSPMRRRSSMAQAGASVVTNAWGESELQKGSLGISNRSFLDSD